MKFSSSKPIPHHPPDPGVKFFSANDVKKKDRGPVRMLQFCLEH